MDDERKELTKEERTTAVQALGITYTAAFVPQSVSRNATEKQPSLNWRVNLTRNGVTIVTDYTQGIGHVPGYIQQGRGLSIAYHAKKKAQERAAETGKYPVKNSSPHLPRPPLEDVLYSLLLDAEGIDYAFEEWCDNFGYSTDSRKAEEIYKVCVEIGIKMQRMCGAEGIAKLRTIFEGY